MQVVTRRTLLKQVAASGLALAAGGGLVRQAAAGRSWCRIDPLIRINGRLADIEVQSYEEMMQTNTGPVFMRVYVPEECSTELVSIDNGFGHGYDFGFVADSALRISRSGVIPVKIVINVPSLPDPTNGRTMLYSVIWTPLEGDPLQATKTVDARANNQQLMRGFDI